MPCDKCGAPSVYHSTLIGNGMSQKTSLCRECALKEGVFNNQSTNIFEDIFSSFQDLLGIEEVENVMCPVCKTSLREFKSSGLLGCPNCYEVFKTEIQDIIKRVAPFPTHKQEALKPTIKKEKLTKEEKIIRLKADMKLAVSEERYEDAAKIKKQIVKLEASDE